MSVLKITSLSCVLFLPIFSSQICVANSELEQLKKIIAVQQAQISELQTKYHEVKQKSFDGDAHGKIPFPTFIGSFSNPAGEYVVRWHVTGSVWNGSGNLGSTCWQVEMGGQPFPDNKTCGVPPINPVAGRAFMYVTYPGSRSFSFSGSRTMQLPQNAKFGFLTMEHGHNAFLYEGVTETIEIERFR